MNDQHSQIQDIAREAGEIALRHFRRVSSLAVESKGPLDLVTAADRDVERFISEQLTRLFPEDGVFGEEGSFVEGKSGRIWVIDPIDGTFNFVRGSNDWGVSIGLFENGAPAYGVVNAPARGELFAGGGVPASLNGRPLPALRGFDRGSAAVGVGIHPDIPREEGLRLLGAVVNDLQVAFRVTGSSVVSLIDIAKGAVDGYIGLGIPSWDILGMLPCLEQLGVGTTIDWRAAGLDTRLRFVCGTPGLLEIASGLA
ncbi:MAG TPA: inositol monophosphatase [Geminicoccaceae bacterium]|nr:inositol monophosphatase [Geminicoccus sp.]HMU49207.1 inositol monophosphatase [Geminicoccaceae bacterium]